MNNTSITKTADELIELAKHIASWMVRIQEGVTDAIENNYPEYWDSFFTYFGEDTSAYFEQRWYYNPDDEEALVEFFSELNEDEDYPFAPNQHRWEIEQAWSPVESVVHQAHTEASFFKLEDSELAETFEDATFTQALDALSALMHLEPFTIALNQGLAEAEKQVDKVMEKALEEAQDGVAAVFGEVREQAAALRQVHDDSLTLAAHIDQKAQELHAAYLADLKAITPADILVAPEEYGMGIYYSFDDAPQTVSEEDLEGAVNTLLALDDYTLTRADEEHDCRYFSDQVDKLLKVKPFKVLEREGLEAATAAVDSVLAPATLQAGLEEARAWIANQVEAK